MSLFVISVVLLTIGIAAASVGSAILIEELRAESASFPLTALWVTLLGSTFIIAAICVAIITTLSAVGLIQ